MTCQDVSFARGRCHIEIEPPSGMGFPTSAARIFIVEDDGRLLRPLTFADGRRVEIRGSTSILALNSAVTYLSSHLGPRATPEFDCATNVPRTYGPPITINDTRVGWRAGLVEPFHI